MNTTDSESVLRRVIKKVSAYIPQVEKPKKKITLTEKFVWSGIALFAYLIMGVIQNSIFWPLRGLFSQHSKARC
jgi:preprotein translocase subunit SecY/protein transport protein SEC61 subunit alpha